METENQEELLCGKEDCNEPAEGFTKDGPLCGKHYEEYYDDPSTTESICGHQRGQG